MTERCQSLNTQINCEMKNIFSFRPCEALRLCEGLMGPKGRDCMTYVTWLGDISGPQYRVWLLLYGLDWSVWCGRRERGSGVKEETLGDVSDQAWTPEHPQLMSSNHNINQVRLHQTHLRERTRGQHSMASDFAIQWSTISYQRPPEIEIFASSPKCSETYPSVATRLKLFSKGEKLFLLLCHFSLENRRDETIILKIQLRADIRKWQHESVTRKKYRERWKNIIYFVRCRWEGDSYYWKVSDHYEDEDILLSKKRLLWLDCSNKMSVDFLLRLILL